MDTKPTKPHPPKPKNKHNPKHPHKYQEFDVVSWRHKTEADTHLLLIDGRHFGDEVIGVDRYCYYLTGGVGVHKTACVGVFPPDCEPLIVSKDHPVREVAEARTKRFNQEKLSGLYPEHRNGFRLRLILVNGWELIGSIESAGQFYMVLRLSETKLVHLYRHAFADFEWADAEPPPISLEEAQKTKQQLADLAYKPSKSKKAPSPPPAPIPVPVEPIKPLLEVMKEEVERTMVNAKIKIVLREIPVTMREVGDVFWIPLQNQPGGVPKGFELSPMEVELVVSKKMWKNALKKAEEQKQQTGNEALYIIEAIIGIHQNRFCALTSSIQVAEAKPKTIEPKRAEDPLLKVVEPTAELNPKVIETALALKPKAVEISSKHQPKTVETTFASKAPETKQVKAPKPLEAKQATEEKPKEFAATAPETKAPKKRVFTATPDGIEEAPTIPEEKSKALEVKSKSPRAKPRVVEVTYTSPSKQKK